jgi:hypothetical protein
VIVVGIIALIGSSSKEIDHSKAEGLIRSKLQGPAPQSISCPSGVKVKSGNTFDCTVTYPAGQKATVTVHMLDDNGKIGISPGDFHQQ